jgi:diguanylate cyclase (GGDEF)-like protein/PAS domain S-box-containing protein
MITDEHFYKNLLDNIYDGVYFVDINRKILYWNTSAEKLTGYGSSEMVGRHCWDNILMHVDNKGTSLCKGFCPLVKATTEQRMLEEEIFLRHKDGHRVPVLVRVSPVRDSNGQVIGALEIFSDNSPKITLMQRIEEIRKMALLDPLTQLGNRGYAENSLHARFDEMERYNWPFGVLFIDIDHFKEVNDSYGHDVGDKVLKMVAMTLRNSVRASDIVARWGGEEFVAIMLAVTKDQLYALANKIRILVEKSSFTARQNRIKVTVSIGAALAQPGDTVSTLIARADHLMYQSKISGRNVVTLEHV